MVRIVAAMSATMTMPLEEEMPKPIWTEIGPGTFQNRTIVVSFTMSK